MATLKAAIVTQACARYARVMPKMDRGPTDGPPGEPLSTVWVTLSQSEANDLLASLQAWSEEPDETAAGWHTHVTDPDGNELTIAIE